MRANHSLPPGFFSVSQFTTWNLSFEEDLALWSKLGIGGIELCERKMASDIGTRTRQWQQLVNSGLRITSVQPRVHALFPDFMCPDILNPADRIARMKQTIDEVAAFLPPPLPPLVLIGGKAPAGNFREAHRLARHFYRELADYAGSKNVPLMFEPLSPVLMNADTFICTLDEAVALIHDVDQSNFGLMLDVWHVWREPNLLPRIKEAARLILGVHICDWPRLEPRSAADRVLPGDGAIPIAPMVKAIREGGYSGAWCLEIFSGEEYEDSLWREDPGELLTRARNQWIQIWNHSLLQ